MPQGVVEDLIRKIEQDLGQHSEEDRKWPSQISARAEMAGLKRHYDSIYTILSSIAHPDPRQLFTFFRYTEDKKIVLNFGPDITERVLIVAIDTANYVMSKVNEHFKLSESQKYKRIRSELIGIAGPLVASIE